MHSKSIASFKLAALWLQSKRQQKSELRFALSLSHFNSLSFFRSLATSFSHNFYKTANYKSVAHKINCCCIAAAGVGCYIAFFQLLLLLLYFFFRILLFFYFLKFFLLLLVRGCWKARDPNTGSIPGI